MVKLHVHGHLPRNVSNICEINVAETFEVGEAITFFEGYYSYIYFLFQEGFTNVDANLGHKGNAAQCSSGYLLTSS